MSKHTEGPWRACRGGECRCGLIWDVTGNCSVAEVMGPDDLAKSAGEPDCVPDYETQKANARLIAAAPELLEALKSLTWEGTNAAHAKARAAIAKAEGRTDPEQVPR